MSTSQLNAVSFNLELNREIYLGEALNVITSIGLIGNGITLLPVKLSVYMKPTPRGTNYSVFQVNGNLLFDADVGESTVVNKWTRGAWEGMLEAYSKERINGKDGQVVKELKRKPRARAVKKTVEGETR